MLDTRIVNGVDIVDIDRIKNILEKTNDKFIEKIFTDREIDYIKLKNFRPETIAGMFAGKEAISKAIGTGIGKVKWHDMEILHDDLGKPFVALRDEILKEYKLNYLEISISHEKTYAVAFVIGSKNFK